MYKVLFLLWMPFSEENDVNQGWILNSPKFYCNDDCKRELYADSLKSNTDDCLHDDVLALNTTKSHHIGMCLREKNGLKQMTTTGVPRNDYRMVCRPSKDRMTWYRGWQSLTFNGRPCIRWDEAPVKYPLKSFSNFSAPSIDYMTLNVFSTTISQHENYCRNPDNHPLGPWCFYEDGDEIKRAPCFRTCVTDIKELCLAKAFFPYYQTPFLLDSVPLSPVDPRLLRSINDTALKKKNAQLDLSDILDVPDVVDSIEHAAPLYSITLTTRHLTQARLAGNAVVTRKKCHQTGIRTLIAGPWTPVKDDYLNFPEEKDRGEMGTLLKDFFRTQFLAGRQGIDKPWRPCFTACEDSTITCWPTQKSNELHRRLFYFGGKVVNSKQRMCIKWTEAFSILYKHYYYYLKHAKSISKRRKELLKFKPNTALQIFYYEELTRTRTKDKFLSTNRFQDGGGRLLHSEICLDLARLIEHDEERDQKIWGPHSTLDKVYHMLYNEGPGCFGWSNVEKEQVVFLPCYPPCPCDTDRMRGPFPPYREMCKKNNDDYEPCTASRDVRNLHIRYFDEKLKPLPKTFIPGVYTALFLAVISATVCLLITWFDQIMELFIPGR